MLSSFTSDKSCNSSWFLFRKSLEEEKKEIQLIILVLTKYMILNRNISLDTAFFRKLILGNIKVVEDEYNPHSPDIIKRISLPKNAASESKKQQIGAIVTI